MAIFERCFRLDAVPIFGTMLPVLRSQKECASGRNDEPVGRASLSNYRRFQEQHLYCCIWVECPYWGAMSAMKPTPQECNQHLNKDLSWPIEVAAAGHTSIRPPRGQYHANRAT
eukprot:2948510-Amphidinium_carterae.1